MGHTSWFLCMCHNFLLETEHFRDWAHEMASPIIPNFNPPHKKTNQKLSIDKTLL